MIVFGQRSVDQTTAGDKIVKHGLVFAPVLAVGIEPWTHRLACRGRHEGRFAPHGRMIACRQIGVRRDAKERRLPSDVRQRLLVRGVLDIRFRRRRRRFGACAPNALNERQPFLAQDALHAADGVAFAVEQVSHTAQQIHIVGAIVPAPAATLERLDLRKAAFPKAQHVLRHANFLGDFADRAERVRRLFQGPTPPLVTSCRLARRHPDRN